MENKTSKTPNENSRRDFLKKAGKVAVAAPAAGLILSSTQVQAGGVGIASGIGSCRIFEQCLPE